MQRVAENEKFVHYVSDMCHTYERHIRGYDSSGFSLGITTVLLLEDKANGQRVYVAYDTTGMPILDFQDGYDLDFKLKVKAMCAQDENDIIRMAERKKDGDGN